jgi:hypothetical protein
LVAKHATGNRYVLAISTKCLFTKFNVQIPSIGKHVNANVICTSFDNQTIQNHMVLYKMIQGTTTFFKLFDKQMQINSKPEGVTVVPPEKLGCNFQNHNKECFSLILHVMDQNQALDHFKKCNAHLKV